MMKGCPITGCDTRISVDMTACRFHWSKVPPHLQREVQTARNRTAHGGSWDAVVAAERRAVAYVNGRRQPMTTEA